MKVFEMTSVVFFVLFTISMASGAFAAQPNENMILQPVISADDININVKVNEIFWVEDFTSCQTPIYNPEYVELIYKEGVGNGYHKYLFKAIKPGETFIKVPGVIFCGGLHGDITAIYHVIITE